MPVWGLLPAAAGVAQLSSARSPRRVVKSAAADELPRRRSICATWRGRAAGLCSRVLNRSLSQPTPTADCFLSHRGRGSADQACHPSRSMHLHIRHHPSPRNPQALQRRRWQSPALLACAELGVQAPPHLVADQFPDPALGVEGNRAAAGLGVSRRAAFAVIYSAPRRPDYNVRKPGLVQSSPTLVNVTSAPARQRHICLSWLTAGVLLHAETEFVWIFIYDPKSSSDGQLDAPGLGLLTLLDSRVIRLFIDTRLMRPVCGGQRSAIK